MNDEKLIAFKKTINQMIEKGMLNEAYAGISQVLKTIPDDTELNAFLSTIRYMKNRSEKADKNVQTGLNTDSVKKIMNDIDSKTNTDNVEIPKGKRRVLLIAYFFPPLSGSGVQRTVKFVKYLRDFGWEPVVLTVEDGSFELKDSAMIHDIPEDVEIIRIPINSKVDNALVNRLFSYYKEVCDSALFNEIINVLKAVTDINVILWPDPTILWVDSVLTQLDKLGLDSFDCIFSTSGPYSDHILGYLLKKKSGKPWIADFRDEWSNNPLISHCDRNLLAFRILHSFEKAVVEYCDGMTVISDQMKTNYVNDFHVPGNKVKSITNGYDEADFSFITDNTSDEKKFVIVHNGIIYKGREPFKLIDAVGELIKNNKISRDKIKVYLGKASFGDNDEQYLQYINKQNLSDIFVFDYLDHKSSIVRTAKASLLLLITGQGEEWKGVLTGKIFEYLRLCKPILNLGYRNSLAAALVRELDRGITVGMNDEQEIYKTILQYYELWEHETLPQYKVSEDIVKFERRNLTGALAAFLDSTLIGTVSDDSVRLQTAFGEALSTGNAEQAQFLIESYRNKFGENAEYVSMQAVFHECSGDCSLALSCLKNGIARFANIADLLYNSGCIYFEQKNYKTAYIFFCLTDYFFRSYASQYNTQNYMTELSTVCNQAPYSEMSSTQAKLFYQIWTRENKNFYNNINDNAGKILESLYELALVSTKCLFVPWEIKRNAMNLVLDCIKYICASESDQIKNNAFAANVIDDFADLKDALRKYFKINVAICGIGDKTLFINNILSPESLCNKAFISDNPQMDKIGNVPLVSSASLVQDEYDYFIVAESRDVKKLLIQDANKIIDYEAYWNLIFANHHNWCVYLNSLEQIKDSEGIVLGISYGMRDIDTKYFGKKLCNIAASGQDLYYDLMLLKKVLADKQGSLKYCIICLAKYSFEYDLSLSSQCHILPYYYYRTHSIHNYKDATQKNQIDRIKFFENVLFIDNHTNRFASNYRALSEQQLYQYNTRVFDSSYLDDDSKAELVAEIKKDFNKNYPLTVQENLQIFEEILELLTENQVKPIVVVGPTTEFYREHINGNRIIADFEKIISSFQNKYGFQYFDYFISDLFKEADFIDYSHLNLKGAEKFTRLLDTEIIW